jgi:hypothetical protein
MGFYEISDLLKVGDIHPMFFGRYDGDSPSLGSEQRFLVPAVRRRRR